jgi:hypothetical protein
MKGTLVIPYNVTMQVTANQTRVLDPAANTSQDDVSFADPAPPAPDAMAMVVVYRGLGPEAGHDYAWDTADFLVRQIITTVPADVLSKVIFVVPDSYTVDCAKCIKQATELIDARNGKISSYSLCGFSRGGANVYANKSLKNWKILGLIDPVTPGSSNVVDSVAAKIRCVYNVNNWDPKKYKDTVKNFRNYLKNLKVKMVEAPDKHWDMPALFFKTYARELV